MASNALRAIASNALRKIEPISFGLRLAKARFSALRGGPALVRLLAVSDGKVYTSEQQFAPFKRFAAEVRQQLGVVVRFMTIEKATRLSKEALSRYDIVALKLSFLTERAIALAIAEQIRSALAGGRSKFLYFDGDDDLGILWPEMVALSDRYVKKHAFSDRSAYAKPTLGKSNLTDYVAREHGWSFADNVIPHNHPLDLSLTSKIVVGWNIGLDDKIENLARRMPPPSREKRAVDVCSRAYVSSEIWIHPLRDAVAQQLEAMSASMKVLIPRNRVGQDEYYREMRSSAICVSPFGYGELCWRDFEAILCGCLLVKPSMEHVETAPHIFQAGETYVPVKWDYSDLPEVCARYLASPEERQRIVDNAYAKLMETQTARWFIDRVRQTLPL